MVCGEICVVSAVHVTKNRCRSPLRVGSTCNVGQKLATFAHVGDMSPTCRRHVECGAKVVRTNPIKALMGHHHPSL